MLQLSEGYSSLADIICRILNLGLCWLKNLRSGAVEALATCCAGVVDDDTGGRRRLIEKVACVIQKLSISASEL